MTECDRASTDNLCKPAFLLLNVDSEKTDSPHAKLGRRGNLFCFGEKKQRIVWESWESKEEVASLLPSIGRYPAKFL